jgi:hypothetical protein
MIGTLMMPPPMPSRPEMLPARKLVEEPFQEVWAEQRGGDAAGQRAKGGRDLQHHRQACVTEATADVDRAGGRGCRDHADDTGADRGLDRHPEEAGQQRDEQHPAADAEHAAQHPDHECDHKDHYFHHLWLLARPMS